MPLIVQPPSSPSVSTPAFDSQRLPRPTGTRPDDARRVVERLVVGRGAVVGIEVIEVLRRRVVAEWPFQRSGAVVLCFRPGERVEHHQAVPHPVFVLHLQRIIARPAAVERVGDVSKLLNRPPFLQRQRALRIVRRRLIEVRKQQQVVRAVADVSDVHNHVARDLALNRDEVALRAAGVIVVRHVCDVGQQGIEPRGVRELLRISSLRGPERGRGQRLIGHRVDDLRTIDGEDVRGARAMKVHVAHPVAASNHRDRRDGPGKAKPRCEIVPVRRDQCSIIERSVPREEHRA